MKSSVVDNPPLIVTITLSGKAAMLLRQKIVDRSQSASTIVEELVLEAYDSDREAQ
jgi:hypothetical protein